MERATFTPVGLGSVFNDLSFIKNILVLVHNDFSIDDSKVYYNNYYFFQLPPKQYDLLEKMLVSRDPTC